MRIRQIMSTLTLGLFLALSAPASDAASLLTMETTPPHVAGEEKEPRSQYSVWVEEDRLRENRGDRSLIVDRRTSRMYVIRHATKDYWAFDLPLDFAAMVPEDLQAQWKLVLDSRKTEVTVQPEFKAETIGGYATKRYEAEIMSRAGGSMKMSMWLSSDLGFDAENYKEMVLEIAKMQPGTDGWIRQLFEIKGFPVRSERRFETEQGTATSAVSLISIDQKEAPASTWLPAEGYAETPFDLLSAPIN
jgi:hypothetical protein